MSTRVQKGNTVFRPVTKTRARLGSEARQSSTAPDTRPSSSSGNNAAAMPPPSAVPRRPSSQLSSIDDLSSDSAQFPADNAPTVSHAPNITTSTPLASPITVPSRHSARPPAIQSFTSSRASTPVPPRIQSGSQARAPISIPTPISTPSRPVPTPIATPSRPVPPPQAAVITQPPQSAANPTTPSVSTQSSLTLQAPVNPPAQVGAPISDAQIDPALLQAITTVLQHANQPEGQMPQPEGTSSSAQAVPQEATPQATPATRSRRRPRPKKNAEIGDSTAASSSSTPRPRRATRRSSNTEVTSEGEQSGEETEQISRPTRRRKRASTDSSTPRKRRSRAPSVPPYDPDADPGEELDPTAVTMAELCDDNGRGRVSSKAAQIVTNHAAWRAANREKRARMRAMMEAKKYGRDAEDETAATTEDAATAGPSTSGASESQPAAEPPSSRASSTGAEQTEGQQGDDFDYTQAVSTSRYNVQVRIGPNGETMIDETSLYVDRQEEEETTNYTHVEESDTTKFVNSMSYSKKLRGSRWSAEETELFFDALSQFGENYELISYVLPGRDRKACKNKFKIEDKRNPNRITFSLKNRRPYDMQTLARMTGKDFSGPPPEIVAPTLPTARQNAEPQTEDVDEPATSVKVRKQSATPGLGPGEGEEVVEIIENYEE